MYPIITLRGAEISMTGIAILTMIATFMIAAYYHSKKDNLQFRKLFYRIPTPIILSYLGGRYIHMVLNEGQLIPSSLQDAINLLSPHDFQLHFIGICLGFVISIILFLSQIKFKEEKLRRIDTIAQSISLAMIPLGFFLLLGDHMIGLPNEQRGVTTFRPDNSNRASLGKVLPIGLFLSVGGLVSYGIHNIIHLSQWKIKPGYLTIIILMIFINIIMIMQNTPKYGVLKLLGMTLDIRSYLSFVIIMICLQQFLLQKE